MHLIIFPFFIYSILGIAVLLLWPQRGLSGKNYLLLISSAMAALIIGLVATLTLHNHLNPLVLFYLPLAFVPAVLSLLVVLKFGNNGFAFASKESVLYKFPRNVLYSGFLAIIAGAIMSLPLAYIWVGEYYKDQILLGTLAVLTISIFSTFAVSGFIKRPTLKLSVKISFISGLTALFMSFILGPYFLLATPIILFVLVATFIFVYILFRLDRNLTNQFSSQAKPAGTPQSDSPRL